jgi:hypothetical protein
MTDRELDLLVADLETENRLLRARNERLEAECHRRTTDTLAEVYRRLERAGQTYCVSILQEHFASVK